MTLIQQIAAAIAKANGDDYADVPRNKAEWARGHWRFRELNEPMQVDYDAMAEAALRALVEAVSASIVDDDKDLPTAADDTREQARLQPLGTDWMDRHMR